MGPEGKVACRGDVYLPQVRKEIDSSMTTVLSLSGQAAQDVPRKVLFPPVCAYLLLSFMFRSII